ncbi:ABC-F family ATP-binding cassette domain-containing protein [Aeromonas enteropelogenes]|uniref:ABC-F family ATP-binding cassette domain-containing protein n=1 Tax=Aeromonas enteropelogenes TaxID=29489 RepID=UPI001CBC27BA|nr:ABC-F family ATP-binding cassette domain-containing protein [Aeromonas enteropelogenes]UAK73344.1 ATP-binding cassette domain-containing protein [Aeromonas enteropelogenes]
MSVLIIHNLTYHIGDKTLYQQASFRLNAGEHVCLTGHNGAGKSTLLQLIQGERLPDGGDILWQPGIKAGYLDQHAARHGHLTLRGYLQSVFADLYEAEAEMLALYADPELGPRQLARAADLQAHLESQGFYRLDPRIDEVAAGLGLTQLGMQTRLANLSGDQRHKVMLAGLLLLDEPTNYLDTAHVDWLAGYLERFPGALLVVSHDRAFVNRIATTIADIDRQQIHTYRGNLDQALAQKGAAEALHARQYQAQQRQIDRLEQFIAKNGAGVNASIANGRKKQLARIERLAAPEQAKPVTLSFRTAQGGHPQLLTASELEIGYHQPLLAPLSLQLRRGEKVVIAGFNGIGKSTLLNTLTGRLTPLAGELALAPGLKSGYFEQALHWPDPAATPLALVKAAAPGLDDKGARQQLARLGIGGKLAIQPISALSGGEQTRVKLCRLALQPTHLLILDEPTTHLDAGTKAALRQALCDYPGSVLAVCHEPAFVADWPDRVVDIQQFAAVSTQA